jgi:hypothetical protein
MSEREEPTEHLIRVQRVAANAYTVALGVRVMTETPAEDEPSRETRLRLARSEIIQWLRTLSSQNAAVAEQTCRGLADRYRHDAARQRNPVVRDFAVESAEKFERLAEQLKRGWDVSR